MQDMLDQVFKAKRVLVRLERSSETSVPAPNVCIGRKFQLDLKLPKFNGDVESWPEFWNLFCVSVNDNAAYSPVEKLVHLKAHLTGQAEVALQGFPVTDQGYYRAVETLKERFDRPDLRRQVLMQRLMSTSPVHNDADLVRLRRMVDKLVSEVRALETMGVLPDSYSVLLMPVLLSCLPESWKIEWLRCKVDSQDELTVFLKFLQREMTIREEAATRKRGGTSDSTEPVPGSGKPTVSVLSLRQKRDPDWVCLACGSGKHGLAACSAYRCMPVPARWDVVRRARLCFQCLGPHLLRACTSTHCPWCGGPHHSSLHLPPDDATAAAVPRGRPPCTDRRSLPPPAAAACSAPPACYPAPEARFSSMSAPASAPPAPPQWSTANSPSQSHVPLQPTARSGQGRMCLSVHARNHCYVQTALVTAAGPRGVRLVRALIDGGSDASFIRSSLADELGLETVGQGTFACVGFKEKLEEVRQYALVSAQLRGHQRGEAILSFWKTEKLCAPVGAKPPVLSLPPSVDLADDFRDVPVDMLIGCDQLYRVVMWGQMEVSPGLRLVETVFGYVLHGRAQGQEPPVFRHAYRCQLSEVERMWTLDAVGVSAGDAAEKTMPGPTWSEEENRYQMGLLWKSDCRPASNLPSAEARTRRLATKMGTEELRRYDDHIEKLKEDGVIEDAPPTTDDPSSAFFLPHRGLDRNDLMEKVEKALYMDDLCPTFSTTEEATTGMRQITEVFSDAKMELHKARMTGDVSDDAVVLGLMWRTGADDLAVTVPAITRPCSRRDLLSAVSKPFDPLGLLTPWLVRGKQLFQRSWTEEQLDWDDRLPLDLQEEVDAWWHDSVSKTVWFPRSVMTTEAGAEPPLFHVFCDASRSAYCAAVYVLQGGEVHLLVARARLAPLKPVLTIPRLELMAALTGARLMDFVRESLNLADPRVTYWSDSMDVLCWIRSAKLFRVFVQNRVTAIRQLTDPGSWQFVPGAENPADLGTRGIALSQLTAGETSERWWKGPPFLLTPNPPSQPEPVSEVSPAAEAEEKLQSSVACSHPVTRSVPPAESAALITSCSDLKTAVNRLAWVRRFLSNSRLPRAERQVGPLTPEERSQSLRFYIREAQASAYREEIGALRTGKLLPAGSPLEKLHPQLSDDGVLEATLRSGERAVPVLPDLSHVTTLIVDDAHRLCFHQGTRVTLALLSAGYMDLEASEARLRSPQPSMDLRVPERPAVLEHLSAWSAQSPPRHR
ncbi:uncharacterized protein LOC122391851 isoform X2 [Amphibalanus amphitrite]|uniref:uncharacterized protein LOC122391851 isoform X2 n=1 Tax=Amphibalanus amphitrite TaxID=1232801 RepID=UPI001C8FFB5B|nr:uncharacterized protein LOC122391851 isoform X2 [Amphibalanus amphitrite]